MSGGTSVAPRSLAPARGPYLLECIGLRTGMVRKGPAFRAGDLAFASGYPWVYGSPGPGASMGVREVG